MVRPFVLPAEEAVSGLASIRKMMAFEIGAELQPFVSEGDLGAFRLRAGHLPLILVVAELAAESLVEQLVVRALLGVEIAAQELRLDAAEGFDVVEVISHQ